MTDIVSVENITSKIFMIRGFKVMIDRYLAELYGVETKQLKRAVKEILIGFQQTSCLNQPIMSWKS